MSGYWAVGSFVIATYPAIVVRIAMTIATIGRRTKRAPTDLLPGFLGRRRRRIRGGRGLLRRDGHARLHALQPFHDDPVSGLEPLVDDVRASLGGAELDDLDRHLVVRSDDANLVASLQLADGPLGNENGALAGVHSNAHLGVLARTQDVARVGKYPGDLDRAGLHVHLAADEDGFAAVRKRGSVGEDQLKPSLFQVGGAQALLDRPVLGDPGQVFLLARVEVDADGIDLRNRRHDGRLADEVADLALGGARDAVDRGSDLRPAEIELGFLQRRLGGIQVGLGG